MMDLKVHRFTNLADPPRTWCGHELVKQDMTTREYWGAPTKHQLKKSGREVITVIRTSGVGEPNACKNCETHYKENVH
jgi:hypothetical protein